ncbi:hypothetical protein ES707_04781 [subsurface metagenome]
MASREQILGILAGESGPMNRVVLSKKLDEPTSNFQNQLDRMEKQGLVEKNEQKEYTVTEAGRQVALAEPPPEETPPGEETEESLKTTEYQQFVQMGKITGVVPQALIEQVATHIWRGGDFRDLTWVWKGLTEMGIRPDLAQRWFHSWRSFLHQAIPPDLAASVGAPTEKGAAKAEAVDKGKRDYILDANGLPLYVGEGVGDLDHDEAVRLSALRQAALARGGVQTGPGGQPATMGTMADEMTKVFNAVKEFLGPQAKGKSYIVKPGEEGYVVEEAEEGKPMLIPTPGGNTNPSKTYFVNSEGAVEDVTGKPIVIKQPAPVSNPSGKTYLVKQTPEGMVTEEYEAGKPIIINAVPPSPGSNLPSMMPYPVIGSDGQPVYDKDGKPVYADLGPMMKWMGFQSEQRRLDERHQMLGGVVKTVRENFSDGIAAIKAAAEEAKGGTEAKTPASESQPQVFKCGDCGTQFSPPAGWAGQPIECPKALGGCGRIYTKEELLG